MGCTATSQQGAVRVFLASLHSKLSVKNIVGLFVYFDYLCTFCSRLRSPEEAGEHRGAAATRRTVRQENIHRTFTAEPR